MSFSELGLHEALLRAVQAEGYHTPTPIQVQAVPHVLAGRDLIGCAQTGTGKTAAFALPTMQRLGIEHNGHAKGERKSGGPRAIRSLVLSPTRELAAQIGESFAVYGRHTGLKGTVVYGGVSQHPQVKALRAGVDVLVATPGRLLDLMQQRHIDLSKVQILILDEADQMLDMGFLPALRRIVAQVPRQRQTLMFSATMPDEIRRLANEWLRQPAHVQATPVATPAELVEQTVFHIEPRDKPRLLSHFLSSTPHTRTLVFARTKHGADKIVKHLEREGFRAAAIHGNKSQSVRQRVLAQFKSQRPPVLVATDIAARGLDIESVSHVINYDMPVVPELYVHRIGRTGRAGATGIAISFCGRDEREMLRAIERLTRRSIAVEKHALATSGDDAARPVPASHGRGSHAPANGAKRPRRRKPARASGPLPFAGAASGPTSGQRKRPAKKHRRW
jgi:ATP-dependent RNA helicase RhlE